MHHVEQVSPGDTNARKLVDHLQRSHSYAVGFLPWTAIDEAIARGHVLRVYENGDECGYAIRGIIRPETRILQIVVADDCRRVEHGTALVDAIFRLALADKAEKLMLHCAEDLDANKFWRALGFQRVGTRLKSKRERRWQIRWEKLTPEGVAAEEYRQKLCRATGLDKLKLLISGEQVVYGTKILERGPIRRRSK